MEPPEREQRAKKIHRGGEKGEIERERRFRRNTGELYEVRSVIWHFRRCAQQGIWGGSSLCMCVYAELPNWPPVFPSL